MTRLNSVEAFSEVNRLIVFNFSYTDSSIYRQKSFTFLTNFCVNVHVHTYLYENCIMR